MFEDVISRNTKYLIKYTNYIIIYFSVIVDLEDK